MQFIARGLVIGCIAAVAHADNTQAPAKAPAKTERRSVAERIVKDEQLLRLGFPIMRTMLLEGVTRPKGSFGQMAGGVALDDPRPTLATITAKYGSHDRVSDFRKIGLIDRDSKAYWYGPLGLLVPKDSADQRVRWVVVEPTK